VTISRREPPRAPVGDTTRINSEIRAREVRVIDAEGKQLGIMRIGDALDIATERMLDLVEVAPNANPPVCRLMDYGKYQFEKQKREREARKAQKVIEIKEVRLRPKTDEHDIQVVLSKIRRFIKEGAKVRVRIRFRGREIQHPEVAQEILERVAREVQEMVTIEMAPQFDGRSMIMQLAPPAS
jgi:translation initiation factor IF-3